MTVYLVGAGPGDPGLITVRGLELVRRADVLVFDRLIGNELLDEAPAGCLLIDASKRPDHHTMTQEEIDACLVEHGLAGRLVVRLKGGDPFVFGRGGEEALALSGAGVPFEVVPGITSAIAAPAYAGIPVTHRNVAAMMAIVTGHERPGKETSEIDWDVLARFAGTLVFLMGVGRLAAIAEALIAAGKDPETP
ncbi:MAG: uroporphyrinogen-III C-methyltransferase, partial [Gaiellales bacterium]